MLARSGSFHTISALVGAYRLALSGFAVVEAIKLNLDIYHSSAIYQYSLVIYYTLSEYALETFYFLHVDL